MTEHLGVLMRRREQFLRFLERRLGSRAEAEDLLQTALVRAISEDEGPRTEEALLSWFYRTMRNLVIDHYRRSAALERARRRIASETGSGAADVEENLPRRTCPCVRDLVDTLKPQDGELIRRVELSGEPLRRVASDLGITSNSASVRLHRARRALREALRATCGACAGDGCFDCTCRASPGRPPLGPPRGAAGVALLRTAVPARCKSHARPASSWVRAVAGRPVEAARSTRQKVGGDRR